MDWIRLDVNTPAERDAVCLALFHAGYAVRQRRRKDGNKTVIYIEYRMDKLKPCPFCGGEADLWENYGRYGYFAFCKCSICSASSKTFPLGRDLPDDWEDTTAARRALDSWNRRCLDAEQDT